VIRRIAAGLLALSATGLAAAPAWAAASQGPVVDRRVSDPRITESSGLAVSPTHDGVLWTHDDSGNPPLLFALTPAGRVTGTVRVAGVPNVDWEAMAAFRDAHGGAFLAVADIGDNDAQRSAVEIDVVAEPDRLRDVVQAPRLRLRLRYPGGARDAETLLVDAARRRMFVVSKGLLSSTVYAVPGSAWDGTVPAAPQTRSATLVAVGTVPLGLVTDGVVRPGGGVLLRTYGQLAAFEPFPVDGGNRVLAPGETAALPDQLQGEGLALAPDGRAVLLSSEGLGQAVLRMPLPPASQVASPTPTPSPALTASSSAPADLRADPGAPYVGGVAATGGLAVVALTLVFLVRRRRSLSRR
jgi:hypothetical protein